MKKYRMVKREFSIEQCEALIRAVKMLEDMRQITALRGLRIRHGLTAIAARGWYRVMWCEAEASRGLDELLTNSNPNDSQNDAP